MKKVFLLTTIIKYLLSSLGEMSGPNLSGLSKSDRNVDQTFVDVGYLSTILKMDESSMDKK